MNDLVEGFSRKKVIVIGDVMLDQYIYGEIKRISPEAPVPIVNVTGARKYVAGGAANVAMNIASLGGKCVLISVVGNDENGKKLESIVSKAGVTPLFFMDSYRITTLKTRIIGSSQGHNQQLLRIDEEDLQKISKNAVERLLEYVKDNFKDCSCILLSDYNKGVLRQDLCDIVIRTSKGNGKTVIADPKPQNILNFKGCDMITPNVHEAESMSRMQYNSEKSLMAMADIISRKYLIPNVIITCGKDGMFIYGSKDSRELIPTKAKEVNDVTGAGDSATAAMALAFDGRNLQKAAYISNIVAGIAVSKPGTVAVTKEELLKNIK